jgi:hypothetical protein
MGKENIKNKYLCDVKLLSARAFNIFEDMDLNLFENFYQTFVINKKSIDFIKERKCGQKTAKELNYFVNEILKDIKIKIVEESKEESEKQIVLNNKMILLFNKGFNNLSERAKNILMSIGTKNLDDFYHKLIKNKTSYKFIKIRACGKKTHIELLKFNEYIINVIENNKESENNGLFSDLKSYIFNNDNFKQIEIDVIIDYFNAIDRCNKKNKTIREISEKYNLTRERVRQISNEVLPKIRKVVSKLKLEFYYSMFDYFKGSSFIIDQQYVENINKTEHTKFTMHFINLILRYYNHPDYFFYCINKKIINYEGVFINKSIPFNFDGFCKFLLKYIGKRRNVDIRIEFADLLNRFYKNSYVNLFEIEVNTDAGRKRLIIEAIKLFCKIISSKHDIIIFKDDFLIIKRNTKKLKYEYLEEILNEYKKPMHYTELFEDCKNRKIYFKSANSVHGTILNHPELFGLKGPGTFGLLEWGGYFGKIGDIAEKYLNEQKKPIIKLELEQFLCSELIISQDSIKAVLFNYENEDRFVKLRSGKIGLKKWYNS